MHACLMWSKITKNLGKCTEQLLLHYKTMVTTKSMVLSIISLLLEPNNDKEQVMKVDALLNITRLEKVFIMTFCALSLGKSAFEVEVTVVV